MEPGENSPCSVAWWWNREKILPAREKWPDFGVFGRAGRVLYRLGQGVGVAGRVLYRLSPGVAVAGRVLYRVSGGLVLEAGENSPCSVAWWWNREKILPAREKWPDFGVFGRAGRVLYRLGQGVGVAGRVLYRLSPGVAVAGRVLYRVSGGLVLEAGENSPCSVAWWWNREKILPAREKWPDFGVFGRAGRVLYRSGQGAAVAGRVLYRLGPCVGLVGGGFVVWSPASPEISR